MYRGPAIQYRIRKTTVNNKTGDNYAITIPRVIAENFTDVFFRILISGGNLIFESGCKPDPTYKGNLKFDTDKSERGIAKRLYFQDTAVNFN